MHSRAQWSDLGILIKSGLGGLNEKEHRDFWVFRDRSKNVIFGFFGVEKFIKIFISSSRNIQNFEKIETHVTIFEKFFAPIDSLYMLELRIETFEGQIANGVIRGQLFDFSLKIRFTITHMSLRH